MRANLADSHVVDRFVVHSSILQPEGVHCIPVVVDLTSFGLLKGQLHSLLHRPGTHVADI